MPLNKCEADVITSCPSMCNCDQCKAIWKRLAKVQGLDFFLNFCGIPEVAAALAAYREGRVKP